MSLISEALKYCSKLVFFSMIAHYVEKYQSSFLTLNYSELVSSIAKLHTLSSLRLKASPVGDLTNDQLLKIVQGNSNLQTISLKNMAGVNIDGFQGLIVYATQLTELTIADSPHLICELFFQSLSLHCGKMLRKLQITYSKYNDVDNLFRLPQLNNQFAYAFPALTELCINGIFFSSLRTLHTIISAASGLKTLNLLNCSMGARGYNITQRDCQIEDLNAGSMYMHVYLVDCAKRNALFSHLPLLKTITLLAEPFLNHFYAHYHRTHIVDSLSEHCLSLEAIILLGSDVFQPFNQLPVNENLLPALLNCKKLHTVKMSKWYMTKVNEFILTVDASLREQLEKRIKFMLLDE